jgi:hypothetical protein
MKKDLVVILNFLGSKLVNLVPQQQCLENLEFLPILRPKNNTIGGIFD